MRARFAARPALCSTERSKSSSSDSVASGGEKREGDVSGDLRCNTDPEGVALCSASAQGAVALVCEVFLDAAPRMLRVSVWMSRNTISFTQKGSALGARSQWQV